MKRFLPLPHGIPAHDTLAWVCARLAPEALRPCFLAWLTEVQERIGGPLASQWVAMDGQAARHRVDRAIDRAPLPMVSAWATASPLVVGQMAVEQKRHEIPAMPPVLQLGELSGGSVTIDALGTQKEMAQTSREQEADDVLALKGHQGTVPEDVALRFAWAATHQYRDRVHQTSQTHNTGHGREERRRTTVTNEMAWLRADEDWVGWQTRALVEAWRTQGDAVS